MYLSPMSLNLLFPIIGFLCALYGISLNAQNGGPTTYKGSCVTVKKGSVCVYLHNGPNQQGYITPNFYALSDIDPVIPPEVPRELYLMVKNGTNSGIAWSNLKVRAIMTKCSEPARNRPITLLPGGQSLLGTKVPMLEYLADQSIFPVYRVKNRFFMGDLWTIDWEVTVDGQRANGLFDIKFLPHP